MSGNHKDFDLKALMSDYSLLQALSERRSYRFGLGMEMQTGPLAFKSEQQPLPLTEDEEAALAFAACGITGYALGDLSYSKEEPGGTIMGGLVGRTMPAGDGIQSVSLIVINDEATYLLKRPIDFPATEIPELIEMAQKKRLFHRAVPAQPVETSRRTSVATARASVQPRLQPVPSVCARDGLPRSGP